MSPERRPARSALVLANGEPPPRDLLEAWRARVTAFWCTDGALQVARELGIPPDVVVGDLDSVTEPLEGLDVIRISEQETTDLDKALRTLVERGFREVCILGAGGRRWDHWWGNLSTCARWSWELAITCADAHGVLTLQRPDGRPRAIDGEIGATVSLLPLPEARGVTTAGLRWPLQDATLALGRREGISNEITAEECWVSYDSGCLAVYRPT